METISWTTQPLSHPRYAKGASKNILALKTHFTARGWLNLGNYGVRAIRGGTNPSAHSFGAAQDLGYNKLTRNAVLESIDFIIANAEKLGVQELHDYAGLRLWTFARRNNPAFPGGWKPQALGSHGGGMRPSSHWIHIETSVDAFDNATPIVERLAAGTPTPVTLPVTPEAIKFAALPTLQRKSEGMHVALLQNILRDHADQSIIAKPSDGHFGEHTEQALKNFQTMDGLPADGIVAEIDWQALSKRDPGSFGF